MTALSADQLSKWWLLEQMQIAIASPVKITGFFNLVMVWNRGISFGMLSGHAAAAALTAVALLIVAGLLWWLRQVRLACTAAAIGLIIGGALGNVIDRLRFGAVADFFDFHLLGYHWPAFNIADAAIFIGVVLLCWESMFHTDSSAETPQ